MSKNSESDLFQAIFDELGIKDHCSIIIDNFDIFCMMDNAMRVLKKLKFSKNIMPVYCYASDVILSKYVKMASTVVRVDRSFDQETNHRDLIYVGVRKSQARYEEERYVLTTKIETCDTKVCKFDKENEEHVQMLDDDDPEKVDTKEERKIDPSKFNSSNF